MKFSSKNFGQTSKRGSVLVLVLWISFGLIVLALYFGNSMSLELRAAANRVSGLQAAHAIDGGARYVKYVLTTYGTNAALPFLTDYGTEALPVDESTFWLIGRGSAQLYPEEPVFGLVDECGKVNLNTATLEVLELLPRMTPELAAAIIDWRDEDEEPSENGAENETYGRLVPPRTAKNSPFETVEELRLVNGATLDILFGEDMNRNGILDLNENDGDISPPDDNRDGRLDSGILEHVTVYSRLSNLKSDGTQKINVTSQEGQQALNTLFQETFGDDRAAEILNSIAGAQIQGTLQFYATSKMTEAEYAQIRMEITTSDDPYVEGLININSASKEVLETIPGIGTEFSSTITSYRVANPDRLDSFSWVTEILNEESVTAAGPFLTDQTYQFTADIGAVGPFGRGYRRVRYIFDNTEDEPKILFRQDQTHLGWALGTRVRQEIKLAGNYNR